MAVDENDPCFRKRHDPGLVFWIIAQIERFGFREGENVMKDRVKIGEGDRRTSRNYHQVWRESPILLIQFYGGYSIGRKISLQIDHDVAAFKCQRVLLLVGA